MEAPESTNGLINNGAGDLSTATPMGLRHPIRSDIIQEGHSSLRGTYTAKTPIWHPAPIRVRIAGRASPEHLYAQRRIPFGSLYGTFGWFITSALPIPAVSADGSGDRQFQWRPTKRRYIATSPIGVAESTARRTRMLRRLTKYAARAANASRQQYCVSGCRNSCSDTRSVNYQFQYKKRKAQEKKMTRTFMMVMPW